MGGRRIHTTPNVPSSYYFVCVSGVGVRIALVDPGISLELYLLDGIPYRIPEEGDDRTAIGSEHPTRSAVILGVCLL